MPSSLTITLPAVTIPESRFNTTVGCIIAPSQVLAEKRVVVDPELLQRVVLAARQAARDAYAPYSHFRVGAAVIMADDPASTIHTGANVENSTYGATVCAERTGLLYCAARGFRRLKYLAVSTADALDQPLQNRSPCGACRQVLKEFTAQNIATDNALILIDNGAPDTLCEVFDIERLLPYGFNFAPSGEY